MKHEGTSAVADDGCAIVPIERAFNPWRQPANVAAKQLVNRIINKVETYERTHGIRQRNRRPNDQTIFLRAIRAIVCDVLVNALSEGGSGIYLSRSHRDLARKTRYNHPADTRQVPDILDAMSSSELALIAQDIGAKDEAGSRLRTVVRCTAYLRSLAAEAGVLAEDFVVVPEGETIVLKRPKFGYWDEGGYMEYSDTSATRLMREDMDSINGWLQLAKLAIVNGQHCKADLSDRQLRRVFTQGDFECGGRLFGGFWQSMKKQDRLDLLLIEGEPIAEVDYGQIMPRLVYALCHATPAMADLYAINGFEDYRTGIKKVMCSMLFQQERLKRMPKGTRELFPKGTKIGEIVSAIEAAHPTIQSAFHTGIGHQCQYLESKIITAVLLRLNHLSITALPIHDAVLVPASAAAVAQEVMLQVFREVTGTEGVVEVVESRTPSTLREEDFTGIAAE